jgi:hypothetical protein
VQIVKAIFWLPYKGDGSWSVTSVARRLNNSEVTCDATSNKAASQQTDAEAELNTRVAETEQVEGGGGCGDDERKDEGRLYDDKDEEEKTC